jgi:hypothetical protein
MPIKRRHLLSGLAALAAAAAVPARAARPTAGTPSLESTLKSFVLYAGGMQGRRLTRNRHHFQSGHSAVLTEVHLTAERMRQSVFPTSGTHMPFVVPRLDRILLLDQYSSRCAVVDMDHDLITILPAPNGYMFSGHGVLVNGGTHVVTGLYHRDPKTEADGGRLMVVDLTNPQQKQVDILPSHGLQPHDMAYLPDGERLVLAHRGSTFDHTGNTNHRYQHEILTPGVTVLNAKDLRFERFIRTPQEAEVSHLAVRADGQVLCCLNQKLNTTGRSPAEADALIKEAFGDTDALLDEVELFNNAYGVALPLPGVLVNVTTGATQAFMPVPALQRQGQSVATHSLTGTSVISFLRASGLLFLSADGVAETVPSSRFGVYNVTGLADLPGTPYMAICGQKHDIVIVDMHTRTPVWTHRAAMLGAPHLTAVRI